MRALLLIDSIFEKRYTIRAMMQRYESLQWIPFPVELVFALFANPANLPPLMPPKLKARIEDARLMPPPARPVAADPARRFLSVAAGEGSEMMISFRSLRWVPGRTSWMLRTVDFAWNSHICLEQVRGPFSEYHHRHNIYAETRDGLEGTLVSDEIGYALPFGPLGQLGGVLIRQLIEQVYAFRQQHLSEILTVAARQAAQRG